MQAKQQKFLPRLCTIHCVKQLLQFGLNTGIVLTGIAQIVKQQSGEGMSQRNQGRCLDAPRLSKQLHAPQTLPRTVVKRIMSAGCSAVICCLIHFSHLGVIGKGPAPYGVEPFSISYLILCFPNMRKGHSSSMSCPSLAFCFRRSICSRSNCAMLFSGVGRSSGMVPSIFRIASLTSFPTA